MHLAGKPTRRTLVAAFSAAILCALLTLGLHKHSWANTNNNPTEPLELLMVESDDCPYCRKFDREIANIYPKTDEGMRAPLKRHKLGDKLPEKYADIDINPSTMTPTFILIKNKQEVDRLVGYNSDEFFWFLLNDLFSQLQAH